MANRKWRIKRSFLFGFLAVVTMALIAFVEKKGGEKVYQQLEVYVQGISDVYFVEEAEIVRLLENEFPTLKSGSVLAEISLGKIEEKVETHPFVKNAEVFRDLKGNVIVKIDQHRPVARIIRPMAAHGYISSEGVVLPTSPNYTTRVLTLEGPMTEELLAKEDLSEEHGDLMNLIEFIEEDKFWSAQIAGLALDKKGEVKIFQQVGKQVIEFGKPVDIEEKFKKISLFYKKILPAKGWNSYERVNVKYKEQIIGE